MKFTKYKPCDNCPFRFNTSMRLTEDRAFEISDNMLSSNGGDFPCHKTTEFNEDGEHVPRANNEFCAGALIFAEHNEVANQSMRIAERLGMYDRNKYMKYASEVFDDQFALVEHLSRE